MLRRDRLEIQSFRFNQGTRITRNRFVGVGWAVALAAFAVGLSGQEKKESAVTHKIVQSSDLKWTPIMKGRDLAPVPGENIEGAPFVLRIRCVDGQESQPIGTLDEHLTVIKGIFLVGMGETCGNAKLRTMNVGDLTTMPKEAPENAG